MTTTSSFNTGTLTVTTPTEREIMMTRIFDAPRTMIFEASTKPDLLRRWFGEFGDWSLVVCEIDLRVGGAYRYVWRSPDGSEMGLRGVYREVVVPERLVTTERFDEPWHPGEALATTVLVDEGGKTTLTCTVLYDTQEIRDAVLRTSMTRGVAAGFDKLAQVLALSA